MSEPTLISEISVKRVGERTSPSTQNRRGATSAAVLKRLFRRESSGLSFLNSIFILNPILILPITVLLGGLGEGFLRRYFHALIIGETVGITCTVAQFLIARIALRFLGIALKRRTRILSSFLGMLPGLWLGFLVNGEVARRIGHSFDAPSFSDYGVGITVGSLIVGVIVLIDLWNTARTDATRLENETLQAKLSALSAQMSPHLLFNALNTIASTIPSDPHAAEETTLRLSELYRGILKSSQNATHTLGEELDLCRAYLSIESARFGDRVRWTVQTGPGLEKIVIPSLLIQPLVENAIKHGLAQKTEGGTVEVAVSTKDGKVEIVVQDDGVGWGNSVNKSGTGTGVTSCRSRLELLYGSAAIFEIGPGQNGHGTRARIALPGEAKR